MSIIVITMIAEIPNGIGCWKAIRKSCTAAMLADGPCRRPCRNGPIAGYLLRSAAIRRHAYDGEPDVTPFDRLGRFVVRRAWWVVGAWVALLLVAHPVRAAGARPAERRRVHPRRPRIGPRQGAPRDRARRPAVRARHRLLEPDARGRHAGVRGRPRRTPSATSPTRPARRPGRLAPAGAAPGLGRRAHGLRHRLPRPAAGRLAGRAADPARAPARRRPGSTSSWPAGLPSTATSRPSPRPTCAGARSSRCRWPRSRWSSCSGRWWPPACR